MFRLGLIVFLALVLSQTGFTTAAPDMSGARNLVRYKIQVPSLMPVDVVKLSSQLAAHGFDVAGVNLNLKQVEVITTQTGIEYLSRMGYGGRIYQSFNSNLDRLTERGLDKRYLNPVSLEQKLKSIAAQYPALTRLEQIGTSIQGRPIWALLISDTPAAGDPRLQEKPALIFDGLHHAREVMTPEVVADVADTLLKAVETNARARQLVSRWQVWLVPMMNPDGSNIVFSDNNMWRKNAHTDQGSRFGVDINRNYVYHWNACNGSSSGKGAQDYRGASAGSEPETQAIMNLAERVRPAASLSYHSYSEFVLTPYGCNGQFSKEAEMVSRIGHELAEKLPTDDGRSHYAVGTPWQLLYDVDGASMDHMAAVYGALAYTFEINTDFQPSYDIREPTLVKHRNAWIYFMNRIDQNLLAIRVIDSKVGRGVAAFVDFNSLGRDAGAPLLRTNAAGRFFKVLDPGSYSISVKLADGRVAQAQVQMSGKPQEVTISVQ